MPLPHLFLSVYSCDPAHGSELTVGWNRIVQAARYARVWALTEDRGQRGRVEAGLDAAGIADRVHVEYLAHDAVERRALAVPGLFYWAYRRWQRRGLTIARRLHAEVGFDLLHHVNMVGFREPGFLDRLAVEAGLPFVLGPVGGTQNTPGPFVWSLGLRPALTESARTVINQAQLRFDRRFHEAARQADLVLAASSTGVRDLARVGISSVQLLETGAPPAGLPRRWADRQPGPVRVLWAGEFVFRKGLHLILAAHERLRLSGDDVHLTLVGDGPYRHLIPTDDPTVTWTGWRPRAELLGLYREADVFAFTSVRDTSGNVVLEALAAGLPVVYLDHQGAHDMAAATCGVPIHVGTPGQVVGDLAEAIRHVVSSPAVYDRLSRGAVQRARALSWDANGAALQSIYDGLPLALPPSSGDGRDGPAPDLIPGVERPLPSSARLDAALLRPIVAPVYG